jgi:hypothetical protein
MVIEKMPGTDEPATPNDSWEVQKKQKEDDFIRQIIREIQPQEGMKGGLVDTFEHIAARARELKALQGAEFKKQLSIPENEEDRERDTIYKLRELIYDNDLWFKINRIGELLDKIEMK